MTALLAALVCVATVGVDRHLSHRSTVRHRPAARYRLIAEGIASWYSRESSGTVTASGEPMRDDLRTCAFWDARFQTQLLVRYGRRSVWCRVNDRGPARDTGRIIDLSPASRIALGMPGTAYVEVFRKLYPR